MNHEGFQRMQIPKSGRHASNLSFHQETENPQKVNKLTICFRSTVEFSLRYLMTQPFSSQGEIIASCGAKASTVTP